MWEGGQGDLLEESQENFFLVAFLFFGVLLGEALAARETRLALSALQGCP